MKAQDPLDCTRVSSGRSAWPTLSELCGDDPGMRAMISRARLLIDRQLPILILGETGTGKEYLARALHQYSRRRDAAMVSVNCGSIPENLIESELFGYQRGAFSGALATGMKGKVVQAHGGTLFLDEIGDMPAAQQTRLLRVLSEREVTPIGSATPISVDLQLICATHQHIEARVAGGAFREDLYYRIAVGILHLPPLRERHDRGWLLDAIVSAEAHGLAAAEAIDHEAREIALAYSWPGNLRQMRSAIQYAWAVKSGETIRACDLPANVLSGVTLARSAQPCASGLAPGIAPVPARPEPQATPYRTAIREAYGAVRSEDARTPHPLAGERENIIRALTASRWNISAASRELGMCRASLYRKLRQLRIPHVRDGGSDLLLNMT